MTQTTVRPGVPVKITLENVRNLKNVTASIYTTNLAGNDDVRVYDAKTFKKFKQNIKNPQMPLTETRQLPYRPNYEQYDDTLTIQGLPCGVYLVELTSQPTTEGEICCGELYNRYAVGKRFNRTEGRERCEDIAVQQKRRGGLQI